MAFRKGGQKTSRENGNKGMEQQECDSGTRGWKRDEKIEIIKKR